MYRHLQTHGSTEWLALAQACRVDADNALNTALEKYERRLAEREDAGSKQP